MLVETVSDCKSSNHIVIPATTSHLIDDERVQRREKVVVCLSLLYGLHTAWVLFMTQALGAGYVYLTWVLATSESPEPHRHEDAIPHLQVVKELSAL